MALAQYKVTISGGSWDSNGSGGQGHDVYPPTVDAPFDHSVTTGGARKSGKGGTWLFAAGFGTCAINGPLTAKLEWPTNGGPRPSAIVVKETATAAWSGNFGACDSGLGGTPTPISHGQTVTGVRYTVIQNPQATKTLPAVSASASASYTTAFPNDPTYISGGVVVKYTVEVTPVTIESNYAVRMGETFNFLVGQEADFRIACGSYSAQGYSWYLGPDHISGVSLSGGGSNPSIGGKPFYWRRDTDQSFNNTVSSPSVFYEGEGGPRTFDASCNVVLWDGLSLIGPVSVTRMVSVYRPTCHLGPKAGTVPCRIWDLDDLQSGDIEWQEAQDESVPGSGFIIEGSMTLPSLFTSVQGDGEWTYVQKCSFSAVKDYVVVHDEDLGLDNTYPYGGYVHNNLSIPVEWRTTYGAGLLDFYDAPGFTIMGRNQYEGYFHGDCYAVLRPPHHSGQATVELPISVLPWNYNSSSTRPSPGKRWANAGSYTHGSFTGSSASQWIATPSSAALTPGAERQPVSSYEMDWDHANLN